jgi:hypothetical protein
MFSVVALDWSPFFVGYCTKISLYRKKKFITRNLTSTNLTSQNKISTRKKNHCIKFSAHKFHRMIFHRKKFMKTKFSISSSLSKKFEKVSCIRRKKWQTIIFFEEKFYARWNFRNFLYFSGFSQLFHLKLSEKFFTFYLR